MNTHVEAVYENGVFRPLQPVQLAEHQHVTVTFEQPDATDSWLADADATISLEEVRRALSKVPGTLAQLVHAEREER